MTPVESEPFRSRRRIRGGRGAFFRFKDVNTKCIHWASRVSAMKFRKFLGRFVALTSVEVFIWWDVT